jgi:chemotaxis protein MotB
LPPPAPPEPLHDAIIVPRRPRETHARHRGGAWKVAYADFVTALMSLFIVLWLVNAGTAVKQSVSGYFRDPRGWTEKHGAGPSGSGEGIRVNQNTVKDLRKQLEEAMHRMPEFQALKKNINVTVTGEGLRIDLMESESGTFFVTGNAVPTDAGRKLLQLLATEMVKLPNAVVVEGHTDAVPYRNGGPVGSYGNWELSTDRAHAARRLMYEYGLPANRVIEVRGCADQRLLPGAKPEDARNRRVSVVVRFGGEG